MVESMALHEVKELSLVGVDGNMDCSAVGTFAVTALKSFDGNTITEECET